MSGPVMGGYKQGTPIPHPETQPDEVGAPSRAKPAGAVPRTSQHNFEEHKTVGGNPRKAH
jgi:hypothetical protein